MPLISELKRDDLIQVWYASASGKIGNLKEWFDVLMVQGPQFAYFPEPRKSFLVVHDTFISEAEELFTDCGIQVVSSRQFLRGVMGDDDDEEVFIEEKVEEWISELKVLVMIGEQQPQVAYSALVKSLQSKWNFVQRVVHGGRSSYHKLEELLAGVELPSLFGTEVTTEERDLFALPARSGGLGVYNPERRGEGSFVNSRNGCQLIIGAIKGLVNYEVQSHLSMIADVKSEYRKSNDLNHIDEFKSVITNFDRNRKGGLIVQRQYVMLLGIWGHWFGIKSDESLSLKRRLVHKH